MSTSSAPVSKLNALHDKLTEMFTKILDRYLDQKELLDLHSDPAGEAVDNILSEITEPSPAMMAVIAKFLKDNDVTATAEQTDELSGLQKSLAERRKARPSLADLKVVG